MPPASSSPSHIYYPSASSSASHSGHPAHGTSSNAAYSSTSAWSTFTHAPSLFLPRPSVHHAHNSKQTATAKGKDKESKERKRKPMLKVQTHHLHAASYLRYEHEDGVGYDGKEAMSPALFSTSSVSLLSGVSGDGEAEVYGGVASSVGHASAVSAPAHWMSAHGEANGSGNGKGSKRKSLNFGLGRSMSLTAGRALGLGGEGSLKRKKSGSSKGKMKAKLLGVPSSPPRLTFRIGEEDEERLEGLEEALEDVMKGFAARSPTSPRQSLSPSPSPGGQRGRRRSPQHSRGHSRVASRTSLHMRMGSRSRMSSIVKSARAGSPALISPLRVTKTSAGEV
ncbi:hypothetical protein CPC08DRAFT_702920, partial [Agrocybe pediades]